MITRFGPVISLVVMMFVTGIGTFLYLGSHRSAIRALPKAPSQASTRQPALLLPGTLYVAQSGALYTLSAGRFQQLTASAGWMQPSLLPAGKSMVAVKRDGAFADLYQLALDGSVTAQLSDNAAPKRTDIGNNHWSFYPALALDGQSVFMSYDSAKQNEYQVDLSIWEAPIGAPQAQWRQWTFPNNYTGGDVQPVALPSGGILYVKYDQDTDGKKASQIWLQPQRAGKSTALTTLGDDCSEPALSPDGKTLAMICSQKQQVSHLVLADFDGGGIGPLRAVVSGQLVAQPAWAPDGSGIAFFAPAKPGLPFQLWWLPKAGYEAPVPSPSPAATAQPSPSPARKSSPSPARKSSPSQVHKPSPSPTPIPAPVTPIQITTDLGFDASSPIAWHT